MVSEELNEHFNELVSFCRRLQDAKCVASGYRFVIRDNKITIDSIGPHGPESESFNIEENSRDILSGLQSLRYALSQWFDLDSTTWNNSNIGRMLKHLEESFRKQSIHIQNKEAYNSLTMYGVAFDTLVLGALFESRGFKRKWRWQKFRALNKHAVEYLKNAQSRAVLQTLGSVVELTIAVDELRRQRGSDEGLEGMMASLVQNETFTFLRSLYKHLV